MDGEKQNAINNKRKAAEELTKTGQELDAARMERQEATRKIEILQKTIGNMEEERARREEGRARMKEELARLEEAQTALDTRMAEAKREKAQTEENATRQGQRIQELEGNKRRRRTEELEATQVLEEVDKLLSPPRADAAPPTEYPEVEPEERTFFQELIRTCCHDECNLSSVRDSEVLRVFRVENKAKWRIYEAKKSELVTRLQTARGGGTAGSSAGAGAISGAIPALNPPLLTVGVQEFLEKERWDPQAREAFLFHGVPRRQPSRSQTGASTGTLQRTAGCLVREATSRTSSVRPRSMPTLKLWSRIREQQ
eukprot:2458428-Rhodomonas_salina.2